MDALRNSKKISLLAVAILFLFTFFNLILDAPVLPPCIEKGLRDTFIMHIKCVERCLETMTFQKDPVPSNLLEQASSIINFICD